jgi:hypothetical protein
VQQPAGVPFAGRNVAVLGERWNNEMRMIGVLALTLAVASEIDVAAAEVLYPWCRHSVDGGTNCGFSTLSQCQGAGRTAYCMENPRYSPATARR